MKGLIIAETFIISGIIISLFTPFPIGLVISAIFSATGIGSQLYIYHRESINRKIALQKAIDEIEKFENDKL